MPFNDDSPIDNRKQQFGQAGEELARTYLEEKGFRWLTSNFRTRSGELDLVMLDGGTLVFVEVKRRSNDHYGTPETAVHGEKRRHLIKAALIYIQYARQTDKMIRFDVVSIDTAGVRHIPDAYQVDAGDYYY